MLYNLLFAIGFSLMLPRFLYRMWRRGGYRRHFLQRLSFYDAKTRATLATGERIWIHAVSVGELFVALRYMESLRAERPELCFALTTTTSTAHALASEKIQAPDVLLYFPLDIPPVMRRVVRMIRPKLLILVECEFWPNMIRQCRRRNVPVWLVNGRISERSHRGYRRVLLFVRRLLPMIDGFCVQTQTDAERLMDIGAPSKRIHVMGSVKYETARRDPEAEERAAAALRQAGVPSSALVLLGGSTWPGEEAALLNAYTQLRTRYPALFLVLVPRHVERSSEVIREIESRELRVLRRSALNGNPETCDVLLVDTTGELMAFYAVADLIFVGKSLTQHGGQNMIEPALYGKPILVGPNMENFPAIMDDFLQADAVRQIRSVEELTPALTKLIEQTDERDALGQRAGQLVAEKSGVIERTLTKVLASVPN